MVSRGWWRARIRVCREKINILQLHLVAWIIAAGIDESFVSLGWFKGGMPGGIQTLHLRLSGKTVQSLLSATRRDAPRQCPSNFSYWNPLVNVWTASRAVTTQ